ncbi:hypothetical protein B9C88_21575 [Brevibacillus laterosporus]|uniref:hypothetical protein n=1 Tax=Brevibacillus laterosporus TaxID=1465 RepID=UPI000BDBF5EA|nr:hypothetical protein [Brevibacillus laterosporus]PCN42293.1 hypothetical protein B9C88_21575 [Brevibacillus laterosporus]
MDLNVMINDSLAKLKDEGFVEKVVKSQLEKTIESVINDSLRSYSDFGKRLEKQVEEQLQINLDKLDIPSYNTFILATIKDHLNAVIHEQGVNRMKEQLDDLLLSAKEEYKLSELMKELVGEIEDLYELGYEEVHEMSLHIETPYGLTYIYFDAESDKDKYSCKYEICIDPRKENEINSIRIREGSSYSRSTKEFKEFDTKTIMGGFYGMEETLFKMYARKSRLILDEKDVELEISNPEYE